MIDGLFWSWLLEDKKRQRARSQVSKKVVEEEPEKLILYKGSLIRPSHLAYLMRQGRL